MKTLNLLGIYNTCENIENFNIFRYINIIIKDPDICEILIKDVIKDEDNSINTKTYKYKIYSAFISKYYDYLENDLNNHNICEALFNFIIFDINHDDLTFDSISLINLY